MQFYTDNRVFQYFIVSSFRVLYFFRKIAIWGHCVIVENVRFRQKELMLFMDPKKKAYSWWIRLDASPTNILQLIHNKEANNNNNVIYGMASGY